MLGDTVREARIRKGLTQAKLARQAGVSRRHLAALEKGANVSVLVLRKVAAVLELTEIHLGELSLRTPESDRSSVNIPLLGEAIREARAETSRAQGLLSRAEELLRGTGTAAAGDTSSPLDGSRLMFPPMPVLRLGSALRESANRVEVRTSGALRQGEPIDEAKQEPVIIPASLLDQGEMLLRADGDSLQPLGIEDGDLLVVDLRPRGRAANGELVIVRIGTAVYVGRWWQKQGQKALMSDGLTEIATGKPRRNLRVVAAINQVIRTGR